MKTKIPFWKTAEGNFLGYLNNHPDHWTQGADLNDLREHLRDLYGLLSADDIPGIRREEYLEIV